MLDASPLTGIIAPDEKQKIVIRFRPGIPDDVCEVALIEVAHFEPQKLTVRGRGIFPGILISATLSEGSPQQLQRREEVDHQQRYVDARDKLLNLTNASMVDATSATVDETTLVEPPPNTVEFEVDRQFLCEVLLERERKVFNSAPLGTGRGRQGATSRLTTSTMKTTGVSSKGMGANRRMKELPPITAAYYTLPVRSESCVFAEPLKNY